LQAGVKSAKLVANNLVDVVVFSLVWFVISIAVGILTVVMVCTVCLMPVAYLIAPMIVMPIELLSKITLWRMLNKSG
jgi:hypothetical protein